MRGEAGAGTAAIELCRHATLIQAVHVLHYLWDGLGTRPLASHATQHQQHSEAV